MDTSVVPQSRPGSPVAPGGVNRPRVMTDLLIEQLPWWCEATEVLPWPSRRGVMGALEAGWNTIRRTRDADAFVCSTLRNAMALGLYKRISGSRRPRIVLTEMRLDEQRAGIRWRLKVALQRFAFAAVDLMCVSAKGEARAYADRLRLPIERFQFVPWHTNVLSPRHYEAKGRYAFAAGRTGRDWRTLAAAVRGLDVDVKVVCTRRDAEATAFPPNVAVLTDVPYSMYRTLLEDAAVVVIPLEPHVYSSGQVVILEAMALGKPVITTRVVGSEDYIDEGVDGLLVDPGDATQLREALVGIVRDTDRRHAIGSAALQRVLGQHTLEGYAARVLALTRELCSESPRNSRDAA